jgi:DNA-binding CsgD family transcriptional regulator
MRETKKAHHEKAITQVLKPIQEIIEADYFAYCLYNNEQCELFSSNMDEASDFVHDPTTLLPVETTNSNAVMSWHRYHSQTYLDKVADRYNMNSNGITFVLRHSDSVAEHISLNTYSGNSNLMDTMKNQPKLIHGIIAHIRNNINFNKEKFEAIYFTKKIQTSLPTAEEESVNLLNMHQREYIIGLNGPTYITRAEKKCLLLLLQMKTSKEIAIDLGITVRTTEAHVANLRNKLGVLKRSDLFLIARNNFITSIE